MQQRGLSPYACGVLWHSPSKPCAQRFANLSAELDTCARTSTTCPVDPRVTHFSLALPFLALPALHALTDSQWLMTRNAGLGRRGERNDVLVAVRYEVPPDLHEDFIEEW
jgi:hypothetical protein